MSSERDRSVFINCPFDRRYKRLFDAIIFTVSFCGYDVRSALEEEDSANVRLEKIIALLKASRYSIHDISRVELDPSSNLPRFNMPLELGAAIGLRSSGHSALAAQNYPFEEYKSPFADHKVLILDAQPYRYQQFVSDLAGVDIRGHDNKIKRAIASVRNFLSTKTDDHTPAPSTVYASYQLFEKTLPELVKEHRQTKRELTYHDRLLHLRAFLDKNR